MASHPLQHGIAGHVKQSFCKASSRVNYVYNVVLCIVMLGEMVVGQNGDIMTSMYTWQWLLHTEHAPDTSKQLQTTGMLTCGL